MRDSLRVLAVAAIAAVTGFAISAQPADAAAREFFKCKLADGVSMDDMGGLVKDFNKIASDNGFADYQAELLSPLFSGDISRGTFFWQGNAPNFERIGALNDWWDKSDANADIRKRWREMTDCEFSSLYDVISSQ